MHSHNSAPLAYLQPVIYLLLTGTHSLLPGQGSKAVLGIFENCYVMILHGPRSCTHFYPRWRLLSLSPVPHSCKDCLQTCWLIPVSHYGQNGQDGQNHTVRDTKGGASCSVRGFCLLSPKDPRITEVQGTTRSMRAGQTLTPGASLGHL